MNNNRGFTLLEILTTIVILGIVLTVFFQFFTFSQKATTSNEDRLVAVNLAEKVLEQIIDGKSDAGEAYRSDIEKNKYPKEDTTEDCACSKSVIPGSKGKYQFEENSKEYYIQLAVEKNPVDSNLNLQTVTVQVCGEGCDVISEVKGLVEQ